MCEKTILDFEGVLWKEGHVSTRRQEVGKKWKTDNIFTATDYDVTETSGDRWLQLA
jgi:hypothetical protein